MISRLKTFSRAAQALNVTQPAVSLRMRQLEQLAGAAIFERRGSNIELNSNGVALLAYAERALRGIDAVNHYLEDQQPWTGLVRVGSSELFSTTALPSVLQALESTHPNLDTNLMVRASTFLMAALEQGQLDAAFVSDPDPTSDCELVQLASTRLDVFSNGELGLPDTISPHHLAGHPILMNPRPSAINKLVTKWLRNQDALTTINTCDSLHVTINLVRHGLGPGIVPSCMALGHGAAQDLTRHTTVPPLGSLTVYLAHKRLLARERVEFLVTTGLQALSHTPGFTISHRP